MVPKVIWSPVARSDLHGIARYIARDRPEFAQTYCLNLIAKVEAVAQFPLTGRQVPRQASPYLRELIIPPYRVVYEIFPAEHTMEIIRVWDARRGDPDIKAPFI